MYTNILDIECNNNDLFNAAITHPSYTRENKLRIHINLTQK